MQLGIVGGEPIGSVLKPQQGFHPVGLPSPGGWATLPSPCYAVQAIGTVTTAATLDWSVAGLFTLTLTTTDSCAVAFANVSIGQRIVIGITDVTGTGTALAWPSTVTWEGGVLPCATPAAGVVLVEITCFGANTYYGTTRALHS